LLIVDTTLIGSEHSAASTARRRTFRRGEAGGSQFALATTFIAPAIWSNGSSTRIKQCRRMATRYDELAANYLAFIQLASIRLWLHVNESTL
jgi:transposase